MENDPTPIRPTTPIAPSETPGESAVYRHEPSGIMERSGYVPLWLKLVVFAIIVWGLYFAIRYWNSWSSA